MFRKVSDALVVMVTAKDGMPFALGTVYSTHFSLTTGALSYFQSMNICFYGYINNTMSWLHRHISQVYFDKTRFQIYFACIGI